MAWPTDQLQRFLVLNGLDSAARVQPGQRVKIVAYQRKRRLQYRTHPPARLVTYKMTGMIALEAMPPLSIA